MSGGGDLKLAQLREIVGLCRALGLKWSEALAEYQRELRARGSHD